MLQSSIWCWFLGMNDAICRYSIMWLNCCSLVLARLPGVPSWYSFHFTYAGCGNNCSSWGLSDWLDNWHSCCSHDLWKLCWIHNGKLSLKKLFCCLVKFVFISNLDIIEKLHLMLDIVPGLGSFKTCPPCGKTGSRSSCHAYFRIDSIHCTRKGYPTHKLYFFILLDGPLSSFHPL